MVAVYGGCLACVGGIVVSSAEVPTSRSFAPDLPPPSRAEVRDIVKKIIKGDEVVAIPGFENLNGFSQQYHQLIQSELEAWQRGDIFKLTWLRTLFERSELDPELLARRMHRLYYYVQEGNIAYQRLHLPGVSGVHSWLVVDMKRDAEGYWLSVIDSLTPTSVQVYRYSYGQKALRNWDDPRMGRLLPETREEKKLQQIKATIADFCDSPLVTINPLPAIASNSFHLNGGCNREGERVDVVMRREGVSEAILIAP